MWSLSTPIHPLPDSGYGPTLPLARDLGDGWTVTSNHPHLLERESVLGEQAHHAGKPGEVGRSQSAGWAKVETEDGNSGGAGAWPSRQSSPFSTTNRRPTLPPKEGNHRIEFDPVVRFQKPRYAVCLVGFNLKAQVGVYPSVTALPSKRLSHPLWRATPLLQVLAQTPQQASRT